MVVYLGNGHVRHHSMEDTIVLVMIQTSWHVPQSHVQVSVNCCDILYLQLDFTIRQDGRTVAILKTFFSSLFTPLPKDIANRWYVYRIAIFIYLGHSCFFNLLNLLFFFYQHCDKLLQFPFINFFYLVTGILTLM